MTKQTPQQRFNAIMDCAHPLIIPVSDELKTHTYKVTGATHKVVVMCQVWRDFQPVMDYVKSKHGGGDNWLFVNDPYEENGIFFWALERQVR